MKGYKPVSVPEDLHNLIEIIIQDKTLGYRSVSDFVISTLRNKTQELRVVQLKKLDVQKDKLTMTMDDYDIQIF